MVAHTSPPQAVNVQALVRQASVHHIHGCGFERLGTFLEQQVIHCTFPQLNNLPLQANAYTRNYLMQATEGQPGLEALVIRWDHGAKTPIHGHPAFSFYYVISGVFTMELFDKTSVGLKLTETRTFSPGQMLWSVGQVGRYDNFIHRVTCLESGLTLHIYSEDAQKGVTIAAA